MFPSAYKNADVTKKCIKEIEQGSAPSSLNISGFIFVPSRQEMILGDAATELGSPFSMEIMSILSGRSQLVALNLHRAQ